jgi:DNA-binding MarR family transcriptional regulator
MDDRSHGTSRTGPTGIGPSCIAYRARMLSRVITAIYDEALAPLQIKGSQLNVLSALARRGPSGQTELCSLLKMDKSTLSRNVERMRRRGWLTTYGSRDGRTQTVRVTPMGLKLLSDALPLWLKAQEEARRRMGDDGVSALGKLIKRLGAFENAKPQV